MLNGLLSFIGILSCSFCLCLAVFMALTGVDNEHILLFITGALIMAGSAALIDD
jgi:hypothetical protein